MINKSLVTCLLLFAGRLLAQNSSGTDSLLQLLHRAGEDSNKVLLMISIGQRFENGQPELAANFYKRAAALSEKIKYPRGVLKYIANYTYLLNMEGKYDSSIQLNLKAVALATEINDREYLAKSLVNTGTAYGYNEDYLNAATYFEKGRELFEAIRNPAGEGQMNDNLQILYLKLRQFDKAIGYGLKAIAILEKLDEPDLLGIAYINLGLCYTGKNQFEKAKLNFNKSLALAKKTGNLYLESAALENLIDIELKLFQLGAIEEKTQRILAINREINNLPDKVIALRALGIYHLYNKNFQSSQKYLEASLHLADSLNLTVESRKSLEGLSKLFFAMNNFDRAELYLAKSDSIGLQGTMESLQKNIQELDKKYETERKVSMIRLQESQLRNRMIINYLLGGASVVLVVLSLLSYRNYRQKQKLQQQRISELETEKKLSATEAVLKGEEQERARLAKDLHDGLSGMLSGVKYSLQDMKGNLIMTEENRQAFARSIDMLDSSIKEMRRVAHNMMPEVLVRYGLDAALKDYVAEINKSGVLKVVYQSMGMEHPVIERSAALAVFRIVQELLNNIIKHAQASEALVQVFGENSKLVVNVEDNGIGFDPRLSEEKGGMGWKNIRSRTDLLHGKVDVQSAPGAGTSVNLDINLR